MKLHPEQGAKLVRRIEGYGPVADIIYAHHERVDGNGYYRIPQEQIPLGSRIIAIADTYDVMTARDSYRRPVSSEAAIMELRRVSGSQLDGDLVETFVEIIESGSRRLPSHRRVRLRARTGIREARRGLRPPEGRSRLDACSIKVSADRDR